MILSLIYFGVVILTIYKWRFFSTAFLSKKQYLIFFIIKLLSGLALYFIYSYHYTYRQTSDSFRYFDDAMVVYNDITQNPATYFKILFNYRASDPDCLVYYDKMGNWTKEFDYGLYNDNRTIIRANMLLLLFSGGNYFVHIIILNFFSFIGLILICRFLSDQLFIKPLVTCLLIFLSPSLIFWSSGVLKEGVLIFGLGLFLFSFQKILHYRLKYLFPFTVSLVLLAYTKFYVLMSLAPALMAIFINTKFKLKRLYATHISAYLLSFILLAFVSPYILGYDFVATLTAKQKDFLNVAINWEAKSKIDIPLLNNNPFNLIVYLPNALINALLRPFFFDARNGMMLFASIENLYYLCLIMLSVIFCNRKKANNTIYLSVFFCLTLAALIGWVTPILGAIVRYKIPLLPFFIIVPVYYINFERLPYYISKPIKFLYNTFEKWTQ